VPAGALAKGVPARVEEGWAKVRADQAEAEAAATEAAAAEAPEGEAG